MCVCAARIPCKPMHIGDIYIYIHSLGTTSSPRHSPGEKRSRRPAVKAVKDGETKAEPQLT